MAVRDDVRRRRLPEMRAELRELEFWRAILCECCATFVYVFMCCGASVAWPLHSANTLTKSFASGAAMATAANAGAIANPALTLAKLVARRITPLRALLYAAAQCGGAIAGAALLYGLMSSVGSGESGCTLVSEGALGVWQAAALEAIMTFAVGLTLFAAAPARPGHHNAAMQLGTAYLACSLIALPATGASMNPARSLGPAFVMNTWTHHWVYWCGPCAGGVLAGLIYEYIFDSTKTKEERDTSDVRDDDVESKAAAASSSMRPSQVHPPPPPARLGQQARLKYAPYYSTATLPRNTSAAYRTWSDYGSQQFKF